MAAVLAPCVLLTARQGCDGGGDNGAPPADPCSVNDRLPNAGVMDTEANAALRAVSYTRVSTQEQADSGAGLAAQDSAIAVEIARRGWSVAAAFVDAGVSGKAINSRPGLMSALALLESGGADVLVVSKLDRLSRSLLDFAGVMAMSQRHGWSLVALDLGVDTRTPAGEFLASILASAAQWERRIAGQRTKDALAARRAQGITLGRPRVVAAPDVAFICAAREQGLSYRDIQRQLVDGGVRAPRGGTSWSLSTIRDIARRGAFEGSH